MPYFYHVIRRSCAVLIGAVFFISGMLKLIDPVGTGLIVEEYLYYFHLIFLGGIAKALGFVLSLLETVTGVALLTGVARKKTAGVSAFLLVFFTLVSVVLYIGNPSFDCGCFGQAVHLTHNQTLVKNLVLDALWLIAFLPWRDFGETRPRRRWVFALVAVSALVYGLLSLRGIPSLDFTPFRPGVDLLAALDNEERVEDDLVQAFVYEKNGKEGSFTMDKLPDSTWTFVREESFRRNGVSVGDVTPELPFYDAEGNYQDDLATVGNVMVVSVYNPDKLSAKEWREVADFAFLAESYAFRALVLLPGGEQTLPASAPQELGPFCYGADRRTLMSLNRSNGGATWFSDGMLVAKYPLRKLPDKEKLEDLVAVEPVEAMLGYSSHGHLNFQGFLLYAFGVILLV